MKHRGTVQLRYFHCPVCHSIITAPKSACRASEKKHRKNMWCFKCKAEQNFKMDEAVALRR